MTIRKHNTAKMNVSGVKKYNSKLDLAKRFPTVFKLKKTAKRKMMVLSILAGIFC